MVAHILEIVGAWIISVISAGGYGGVMLLMAIESACIPLPRNHHAVLGILVYTGRFSCWRWPPGAPSAATWVRCWHTRLATLVAARWWSATAATFSSAIASSASPTGSSSGEASLAVLIARLLPVIRTFIALPAGVARMPRLKFHIYTFVGSWPWCFAWRMSACVGRTMDKDPRLKMWFHRLDAVILAVIILAVAYFVWSHLQHRVGREAGEAAE